jgi:hypothetical protein
MAPVKAIHVQQKCLLGKFVFYSYVQRNIYFPATSIYNLEFG